MSIGRALILGGGGVAGIGWEAGLIAGLQQAGVDVTDADLIVGTSAGAVVGSFVAQGADVTEAIDRIATRSESEPATLPDVDMDVDMDMVMTAFELLFDESLDPREARAKVGRMALEAPIGALAGRLEEIGQRLPSPDWPDRRLIVTGVDAEDGSFVAWDRDSGAPLPLAVAASCAVPCVFPPVEIGGHRYMDGGTRSITNADLAKGAARVVVVEPMAHWTPRKTLQRELAELGDAQTVSIGPDQAAIDIFGANVLDPRLWRPAFAAGLAQAPDAAESVKAIWLG